MDNIAGNIVKRLRKEAKITQSELAANIGLTRRMICAIELGESQPTMMQLKAFSSYFGVSTDYLIFGVESIKPSERELLTLIKEDSGLMQSLMCALTAKKNVLNRLAA